MVLVQAHDRRDRVALATALKAMLDGSVDEATARLYYRPAFARLVSDLRSGADAETIGLLREIMPRIPGSDVDRAYYDFTISAAEQGLQAAAGDAEAGLEAVMRKATAWLKLDRRASSRAM